MWTSRTITNASPSLANTYGTGLMKKHHAFSETHPGEILREDVLPAFGKSKTEISSLLGISRQTLYDILAERQGITAEMAVRLGKLCGNGPDFWLALQSKFDLSLAKTTVNADAIPTLVEV